MTSIRPVFPAGSPADQVRLLGELEALLPAIEAVDVAKPADAEKSLEKHAPLLSPLVKRIEALAKKGAAEGWLLPKSAGPKVRFGRFLKDLSGFSVDFVSMEGPAAGHTHTKGEINLGFALSGKPLFDGRPPGWAVFPPASHHIPTVTGGEMLIVYFVPGGQVVWDAAPKPKA